MKGIYFFIIPIFFSMGMMSVLAKPLDSYPFINQQQSQRFQGLTSELRCLVCQNQNLADSDAPLAADLRKQIASLIVAGKTNEVIKGYLAERYGDFIFYRPPLMQTTYMLWFGPFFLLILGLLLVYYLIYYHKRVKINSSLSAEERQQALKLLTISPEKQP